MQIAVVVDSNILFRILISQGDILEIIFNPKTKLYAPFKLKEEFEKHKKELIQKTRLSEDNFEKLVGLIFKKISFIPIEQYETFIESARRLLKNHLKDEDFVALALSLKTKIWTYEDLLFKIGIGLSTKEIAQKLSQ